MSVRLSVRVSLMMKDKEREAVGNKGTFKWKYQVTLKRIGFPMITIIIIIIMIMIMGMGVLTMIMSPSMKAMRATEMRKKKSNLII